MNSSHRTMAAVKANRALKWRSSIAVRTSSRSNGGVPRRRALVDVALAGAMALSTTGYEAFTSFSPAGAATVVAGSGAMTAAQVRSAGNITLHLLDYQTGGNLTALQQAIKGFEKEFPNIKIISSQKAFAAYGETIALSMSSSSAPDIAESNAAMAPRLVAASLVTPLNKYYGDYGWDQSVPTGIKLGLRLSADGKVFGTGKYWGMAVGGNLVGVYYNKTRLKSLGEGVPSTYNDIVNDMAKAKAAGIVPLEMGNLQLDQAGWLAGTIIDHYESVAKVNAWVNGSPGATIDTPAAVQALTTMQDWVKDGYISPQANGIDMDTGSADFAAGKALFDVIGSWQVAQFDASLRNNGGFMVLPDSVANKEAATGWFSEGWTISSHTKYANIAAYFLNYFYGPACTKNNILGGYLPFSPGASTPGHAVAKDLLSSWYQVKNDNGLTGYLDSATPSMGNTEFPALQSLIALKETPKQVVAAMQANWKAYHTGA